VTNFHLYFLIHLTKYLGFFPDNNYSESYAYFDLKVGSFVQIKPRHLFFIDADDSQAFSKLCVFSDNQHDKLKISSSSRINILDKILDYYSLHNEGVSNVKSLSVLRDVFH